MPAAPRDALKLQLDASDAPARPRVRSSSSATVVRRAPP